MTATPFEKLTAMWQSGEINDEEFKLATAYLKAELAKASPSTRQGVGADASMMKRLAGLLLTSSFRQKLTPVQLWLVEIALFLVVAGAGVILAVQLFYAFMFSDVARNLRPMGAAVGTMIVLATGGVFVGYNRRALGVISVPLFLLLLFSPLWKSPEDTGSSSKVRSITAYERLLHATEYGADWPFPGYNQGTLRCERKTVSGVTRSLVTVELSGKVYGLNGAAKGWGGYDDSRYLMAKHPEWGTYELGASGTMIADALARCR